MTRNINDIIHDFFTNQRSAEWLLGQLWSNAYHPSIPKGCEKQAELAALKMAADEATLAYQTAMAKAQVPKPRHIPFQSLGTPRPTSEDKSTIEGPGHVCGMHCDGQDRGGGCDVQDRWRMKQPCSCRYEPEGGHCDRRIYNPECLQHGAIR